MKGEFDFIHYIKKSFGLRAIGDDCAVLPKNDHFDLVVTADLMIEEIDFRLDRTAPEDLGHKALAISLSDVAAMGAKPVWGMLTLGIPDCLWESDFTKRFYDGWSELAREFDVELVGGDISRSPDKLVIDSIVGGDVEKGRAILRSGARAGDRIYVSGRLGGAAGGLRVLDRLGSGSAPSESEARLVGRQLRPTPRVTLGRYLLENEIASAMIDLSDGLSSDIHHICEESGVGAELDASLLPIDADLRNPFGSDELVALALNGGEDFELLFTVPPERTEILENQDVTSIGSVTQNAGVVLLNDAGKQVVLRPSGYRHF